MWTGGWTDQQYEANSCFSKFCKCTKETLNPHLVCAVNGWLSKLVRSQNYMPNMQIIDNKALCTCYYYTHHLVIEHNITLFSMLQCTCRLAFVCCMGSKGMFRAVVKFFNLKSLRCSYHICSFYCINSVRISTKNVLGIKRLSLLGIKRLSLQ